MVTVTITMAKFRRGVIFIGIITMIGAGYHIGKVVMNIPDLNRYEKLLKTNPVDYIKARRTSLSELIKTLEITKTMSYISIAINAITLLTTLPVFFYSFFGNEG